MIVRKTTRSDLEAVWQIYENARKFMIENGNPMQWGEFYPPKSMIERDIEQGDSYICVKNDEIVAVFYYKIERDPTYEVIDGAWQNDLPYGVVHRIAAKRGNGAGEFCINWAVSQCKNLKIDTHEDNAQMRKLLQRLDFTYCGIIWVLDGTEERIAFQKTD